MANAAHPTIARARWAGKAPIVKCASLCQDATMEIAQMRWNAIVLINGLEHSVISVSEIMNIILWSRLVSNYISITFFNLI